MIRKRLIPRIGQTNDQPQQPGEGGNNITGSNNIQGGESVNQNLQGENLSQNPNVDLSQGQGNMPPQQFQHYQGGEEKSAEAKKKTRCRKWPMCKNENCEFAHPKETVF
jgi:hypothetical protein